MQTNRINAAVSCWLSGVVLAAALVSVKADTEDETSKSFQVQPGGKLIVDVGRGSIDVKSGTGNAVEVTVFRKVDTSNRSRADEMFKEHKVEFTQDGNDVKIFSENKKNGGWFKDFWRGFQVRYVITVPRNYNVDLKTSGGGVSVADLEGSVKAKTSGGSMHFGEIRGPIWARTSGGSISLEGSTDKADVETSGGSLKIGNVQGTVTARTSGGSIAIQSSQGDVVAETSGGSIEVNEVLGKLQASTSGGSIRAKLSRQPEGDCSLTTSGGSIEVSLAEKIAVDLDARTSGGRVMTEFPVTVQGELKRTELKAKLNGGGPALVLHTSGGNVRVKKL